MKPNVVSIELTIHYGLTNASIELTRGTSDDSTFDFHILDIEQEHRTGRTTVQFNDSKELIDIIHDFDKRFNLIKKI